MKLRKPLQQQLFSAWKQCIKDDYTTQRINSEPSLLTSFWAKLNDLLPKKTRRMFVEPPLAVNGKNVRPDLVICNTKEVIAVVELKYRPRKLVVPKKDLETLRLISAHRKDLAVANERFHGPAADAKGYPFANDVLFVWAGVHRPSGASGGTLLSDGIKELAGCFLELHAETDETKGPEVFAKPKI